MSDVKFVILLINMTDKNISKEFGLKKIDRARNYVLKEIKSNYLI